MLKNKKNLGQFFTTNVDYILNGFEHLLKDKIIIDPFAGCGDLLNFAKKCGARSVNGFDIDKELCIDDIKYNDSLKLIPKNSFNFNLTNPPYLGKNKMPKEIKNIYDLSDVDDFYLLALKRIMESDIQEGIIIIPVNFLSAENSDNIRRQFFNKYDISRINYFTEQVFSDTTYNVIAFHYIKNDNKNRVLNINIFPENKNIKIAVYKEYNYRIGGKEINDIMSCDKKLKITRLTENIINNNIGNYNIDGYYNDFKDRRTFSLNKELHNRITNNIIAIECIDGKKDNDKICAVDMRFRKPKFLVGKNSSRNILYVLTDCNIEMQGMIIEEFNRKLTELREKYCSLFLTNFRDNNRKRISFEFCYNLMNYTFSGLR